MVVRASRTATESRAAERIRSLRRMAFIFLYIGDAPVRKREPPSSSSESHAFHERYGLALICCTVSSVPLSMLQVFCPGFLLWLHAADPDIFGHFGLSAALTCAQLYAPGVLFLPDQTVDLSCGYSVCLCDAVYITGSFVPLYQ